MRNRSTNTEEKYLNFLSDLASRQRGFTSMGKLLKKNHMATGVATVLGKKNLIKWEGSSYKWNGPTPNSMLAREVLNDVNRSIRKYITPSNGNGNGKGGNDKPNGHKASSTTSVKDVLNIADLRAEKSRLESRIEKINSLLEVVDSFQNGN